MTERVSFQDWMDGQERAFEPVREALTETVAILGRIEALVRQGIPRAEAILLHQTAARIRGHHEGKY